MTPLKPTARRLRIAAGIIAGEVIHYPFATPLTIWQAGGLDHIVVTGTVAGLVAADLAEHGPTTDDGWQPVRLTDAGRVWLTLAAASRERTPT